MDFILTDKPVETIYCCSRCNTRVYSENAMISHILTDNKCGAQYYVIR